MAEEVSVLGEALGAAGAVPEIVRGMGRAIQSADRSIYYFFGYFQGNWALDRIASQLESDTLLKTGPVISLLWYFWFRSDGDPYERRTTILTILTGTFLGLVVTRLLATLTPFRTRPIYEAGLVHHAFSMPMPSYFSQMSSFPSDHAAYLAALGFGLIYLSRRLTAPVIAFVALWICLPRVYMGIHYASDIVAGCLIGIAAVWGCERTQWVRNVVARPLLAFMDAKPQVFYAVAFVITFELGTMFLDVRELSRALLHVLSVGRYGEATELLLFGVLCVIAYSLWRHHGLSKARPIGQRLQSKY